MQKQETPNSILEIQVFEGDNLKQSRVLQFLGLHFPLCPWQEVGPPTRRGLSLR